LNARLRRGAEVSVLLDAKRMAAVTMVRSERRAGGWGIAVAKSGMMHSSSAESLDSTTFGGVSGTTMPSRYSVAGIRSPSPIFSVSATSSPVSPGLISSEHAFSRHCSRAVK
jgi:hypothetical protein